MTAQQKNKLKELRGIVGDKAPENVLIDLLKRHNYDTNGAMDEWYNSGMDSKYSYQASNASKVNENAIK